MTGNVTYGGVTHTAGVYVFGEPCHGLAVAGLCRSSYQSPFPPNAKRDAPRGFASPVCAVQHGLRAFTDSLLADASAAHIVAPAGSCEDLYGAP